MTETTREALISAAADLLDKGGPAAVTLRGVGRTAGVSHNAPYKHFADKEDLLAAVASRELALQARGRSRAKAGSVEPGAVLKARMQGYVRWALRHPERFKLTFGRWTTSNAELGVAANDARAQLVQAVVAAQAAGQAPAGDPERVAALVLALAHGAADLTLGGHLARDGKGHASAEDLVDDLFALFVRGRSPV
jgi:AcrR family transcriptional regulator